MRSWRMAAVALAAAIPVWAQADPAARMVDGIHAYLDRATAEVAAQRPQPSRERLRRMIGAVDPRVAGAPEIWSSGRSVRWPVFDGVTAEGVLLDPRGVPLAAPSYFRMRTRNPSTRNWRACWPRAAARCWCRS